MKKSNLLILLFIISLIVVSCGNHFFNPKYYYNKSGENSYAPPDTTPDAIPDKVDPSVDPFNPDNGEWNDPNYGDYHADNFKTWLFKSSFQNNKLPVYKFFEDNRSWKIGNPDWNGIQGYSYNPNDGENTASGYSIDNSTIYKYVGNNPLYSKEGYLEGRLDRFNFYSIYGKTGFGTVTLQQYLVAVDTYSKFVFAFGYITEVKDMLGDLVPMAFEAIEKHADNRPFFEYDPIGYVEKDGTVVLYEHYRIEFVKSPTTYEPKIHPEFSTMAKHTQDGQGNSPYFVLDTSTINPEDILDKLKNNRYGIRDKLVLYEYKFDDTGKTLTLTSNHYYDGDLGTETYYYSKVSGLTAVEYTNTSGKSISIAGVNDFSEIYDKTRTYILNYTDPGPDFVDRVAGKIYKASNGSYEYRFSGDGNTIQYYENGSFVRSYTFSSENKSAGKAEYKVGGAEYWGVRLADDKGKKDDTIYWSLGSSPFAGATSALDYHEAYLNVNVTEGGFVANVKGKTYKYRDYSEYDLSNPLPDTYKVTGKSLILYTYKFDNSGNTLEVKEEVWRGNTTTKTYTLKSSEDKSAVYESNGTTIELSLKYDNETLYKGDDVAGQAAFIDEGPIFLDRVKDNPTFTYNGNTYEFKDGGKTIIWNGNTWTLSRYDNESKNKNRAVYKYMQSWGLFDVPWYYGVELSNNDDTIKSTSKSSDGVIMWGTLGDEGHRQ